MNNGLKKFLLVAGLSAIGFAYVITAQKVEQVNLRAVEFHFDGCDPENLQKEIATKRMRDVFCSDYDAKIEAKDVKKIKLTDKEVEELKLDREFKNLVNASDVLDNGLLTPISYKKINSAKGKLLGYQLFGVVTQPKEFNPGSNLKVLVGLKIKVDKPHEFGHRKVMKYFLMDRSPVQNPKDVPTDLKEILTHLKKHVVPVEKQGLWELSYEFIRLPGAELDYKNRVLLDHMLNKAFYSTYLGSLGYQQYSSRSLNKNADRLAGFYKDMLKLSHAKVSGENAYLGQFCENFYTGDMIQGKKEFYEIPASDKQKICSKGVTSIVDVVVENTQYFYVLNADIDEEEHAYLLIPSSDKATSDWFLKIYFDISHNE